VTQDPRAFLAIDRGAATTSAALIGRIAHRWRLIGSLAVPAPGDVEAIGTELVRRLQAADPGLIHALALSPHDDLVDAATIAADLPRLVAESAPARTLLTVAVSDRALRPLLEAARQTGWRTRGVTRDELDPLALTNALLDLDVDVLLVGAGDPPGADERRQLDELAAIVGGAVARRPELTVVLAGAMADHLSRIEPSGERRGEILLAPAASVGDPPGDPLRKLLDDVRGGPDDPRASASPGVGGEDATVQAAIVADAALVPPDPDDATVDRVLAWSTISLDRHRLRDRLRELRLWPWSAIAGDGARLRLAAARAALTVLVEATPEQSSAAVRSPRRRDRPSRSRSPTSSAGPPPWPWPRITPACSGRWA
jgi:hypothetical protein